MSLKKCMLILIGLIFILTIIIPTDSSAIPAFARRNKISCSTCHAPFPKLKPYGADFAGDGFILKENEKERDYITAGDDLLWLNREFPLAARFDAYTIYDQDNPVEADLQIPWGVKLLSGGTLYKNIGYYFYFYMSERGEVAGIEDAYIHFDNIFGTPLDVMVGQFQTSDPLMKRELRLTFEDYELYKPKIGMSQTNLTYDRGIMLVYGIEKTGTDLVGMIVNGNGKGEAGDDKKFDKDGFKNFGFRLAQGIGDHFSIGGFIYTGQEKLMGEDEIKNQVTYWGPDFNVTAGPIELTGEYLVRKDTNPYFSPQAEEVETRCMIAELVVSPQLDRSRFYFTALYNKIDSDLNVYDYQTATLSGTYLLSRNLRFTTEFTRDLENDTNRFVFGLITAY